MRQPCLMFNAAGSLLGSVASLGVAAPLKGSGGDGSQLIAVLHAGETIDQHRMKSGLVKRWIERIVCLVN